MNVKLLRAIADSYVHFEVEGKKVQIPYCIVRQPGEVHDVGKVARTSRYLHFGAKGTPEQIRYSVSAVLQKRKIAATTLSSEQLHTLMIEEGIGVDCSGFVFNVMQEYLRQSHQTHLGQHIYRFPGLTGWMEKKLLHKDRVRRSSAKTLTSQLNTVQISAAQDIQPGDMLRLSNVRWPGKHIALIVEVTSTTITYAHSSEGTEQLGPHYAHIQITYPEKGLEHQQWLEKTKYGTPYVDEAYDWQNGDSVRRLKFLLK